MKRINIDGKELVSPKALHDALKSNFAFPEYYGGNLDSLYDVLTDIHEPICLAVANSADARSALDGYWWSFIEVFSDAQAKTGKLRLLLM